VDRIGTDESGKGDYFGPLVVAAVHAGPEEEKVLKYLGVKDCKRLSDARVLELDAEIRRHCKHSVVRINPEKYNALHAKFGNLNHLLAWAHAKAIETILKDVMCKTVISDQFGDEKLLRERLEKRVKGVELIQRHRAESDPAVAAASVVARAEFLRSIEYISGAFGIMFPKGATKVVDAGRMFVAAYGSERLPEVAKVHFRTTDKLKCLPPIV
jgi:ribonuclease HIII